MRQDSDWTNPPIRYGRVFVNTSAYAMWAVINCLLVFGFGVSGEVYVLFCCLGHVYCWYGDIVQVVVRRQRGWRGSMSSRSESPAPAVL